MTEAARYTKYGRYGESFGYSIGPLATADEGNYYHVTNALPSTPITDAVRTTYSSTSGLFYINNTDTPVLTGGQGTRIYMDFLRLLVNIVPASATSFQYLVTIDNIVRYSSGGTQLTTVNNSSMDSGHTALATVFFGAVTLAAASASVRQLSRGILRGQIPIANDVLILDFTMPPHASTGAATAGIIVDSPGPAIIGAGHSLIVHTWYPGNSATAAQFEVEAGFWQR